MANLSNINNILRTGSLGVGINRDPLGAFEISSATKPGIKMFNTAASGKTYEAYSDANGNYIIYDQDADDNRFVINTSGNATFAGNINAASDSFKYELDSSGNALLDLSSTGGQQIRFFDTNSSYTEAMRILRFDDKLSITYGDNANEEALTVVGTGSSAGNVGIGTVNPKTNFEVIGGLNVSTNTVSATTTTMRIGSYGASSQTYYGAKIVAHTNFTSTANTDLSFDLGSLGEVMRLHCSGSEKRVGIGTTSPDFALDIEGLDSGVQLQIGRTNSSAGSTWMGADSSGFHLGVGAYGSGNSVSDPNGFTVLSNGKVGIGTASPKAKLDVDGDINTTGYLANTLEFSTYFGSGTTVIATLNGSFESGTAAVASIEYVGLYAYAGTSNTLGIIMASTRRSNNNTAWSDVNDETVHVAGSTSKEPTLYWDNGLLKITVGSSVQISCRIRITYHGNGTGLTRNHSA